MTQESQAETIEIGARIRELRLGRQLSLRKLAETSRLSINTISLVERNKISPSLSTLHRIAMALGVPITTFFEEAEEHQSIICTRATQRPTVALPHGHLERLGNGLPNQGIEPLLLTLDVGKGSGPDPIVHTGHEFVFCLRGRLFYEVDNQHYVLDPGDSLFFEARLPHRWNNIGEEEVEVLMIFAKPDGMEGMMSTHLPGTGE
jgi:transcriptional regulator with XRE-family HTH domain